MASEDYDKFVKYSVKNVLENWWKFVAENIKNDLEGKESPKEIPMVDALENIGLELTPEEKEYFKDKVLTSMDISGGYFTKMTDSKATVTVNYVKYDPEEK